MNLESNCVNCRHYNVCSIKKNYLKKKAEIQKIIDGEKDVIVKISCKYFVLTPHALR